MSPLTWIGIGAGVAVLVVAVLLVRAALGRSGEKVKAEERADDLADANQKLEERSRPLSLRNLGRRLLDAALGRS